MAMQKKAFNMPQIIDNISVFIENQVEMPDTYLEAVDRSINNLLVEYFKQNPYTTKQSFNEDGSPKPVEDVSGQIINKIRDSVRWMNKLSEVYSSTYLRIKQLDNIPTKGEYFATKNIAEKYSSYKRSLSPAKIGELRNALSVILYNTEIADIPSNVTRILYAIQRLQLGHPNPNIGVTALFFYSVSQGNGKSTVVNSLLSAARKVGLNAITADIEKITNRNFADMKQPLDCIHLMCQPSFLKESKEGFNRKILENLIDGETITFDVKFKNFVTQRFEGLIVIGGNGIPKVGDRRYSVIHLIEDKLGKFENKPSKQDIEKAWIYLLTHVVDDEVFKTLIPWESLNNQKGVQNITTKSELYNVLIKMCDQLEYDSAEVRVQVQSVLARFGRTIAPNLRSAYKEELKELVDQGIIACNTENITNISILSFSRNDLAKLDFGDESKDYDYQNHTKLISQEINKMLPDSLEELKDEDENGYIFKPNEFLEWGLYGYDPDGEYEVLNILKSEVPQEGYVSPRTRNNCYMRRFLYESDNLSLVEQKAILEKLIEQKSISRAVYSGSKSIHIIVEIDMDCEDIDEYKFFWSEIAKELGLNLDCIDNKCSENSRLTRRPNVMRKFDNKEKFDNCRKDAVELFGAKVELESNKIEQKLLYAGYNVYDCYFRIKNKYLETKISKEVIVSKKLVCFDGENTDISTFIINYANKNAIDLDFSKGNGHNLGCTLIGACKKAGFESDEIENWLHDNCYRFDELRPEWKGLL